MFMHFLIFRMTEECSLIKERSIKKNYIFNTAYQVLALCTPLITAPYLSRTLGADGIGIQSYTNSIVSYFILVAVLGSTTFGQRKIATVRENKDELSRTFWEIVFFRMFTVVIVLIFYAGFLILNHEYFNIYLISTINIVNVFVDITWFYQGVEDFPRIVVRNCIIRLAQIIAIFVFVKSPDDLALYVMLLAGFTFLANVWTWLYVPQYINKPNSIHIFKNLKDMILLFLPTIATQVYLVLDKSMIGIITDSTYQNGCYEQSEKIARMALTIVTSVAAVILPRVANLYNNGEKSRAIQYVYKGYRFVWMLSMPIMLGLIGISSVFVPVFFGEGYDLAEILMPIFSVLVVAVSLAYVTGYSFLIPTGQQNVYTAAVTVAAGVNLVLNLCMIPILGAIGAAIASVLAEIIGVAIQIIFCCRTKQLQITNIFSSVWRYAVSAAVMLVLLLYLQRIVSETVIGLLVLVFVGGLAYAVMLVVLGDMFFVQNVKNICTSIRNKVLRKGN